MKGTELIKALRTGIAHVGDQEVRVRLVGGLEIVPMSLETTKDGLILVTAFQPGPSPEKASKPPKRK